MAQMDENMGTHLNKTTVAQLNQRSYSNSDFVRNTFSRSNEWYNLCTIEFCRHPSVISHKPFITDCLIRLDLVVFGLFPDKVTIT